MAVSNVSSTTNSYSNKLRMGGLATGLDTDTLISNLMKSERVPLDKIYQKKQKAEWKRDAYRDATTLLRGLKSDFLDITKPANNMLSESTFKKFTGTSTNSSIVTITGDSAASAGSHSVTVYNLATADKAISSGGVTDVLEGSAISNYNLSGKSISITLDGVYKEIKLDNYTYTAGSPATSDIVSKADTGIQALLDKAFGAGKITASYDGSSGKLSLASTGGASKITVSSGSSESSDAMSLLGFSGGATNRINVNQSLEALSTRFAKDLTFDSNGKLKFTINSKSFEFDKSVSLSTMMTTISNDSTAKVNMSYDETSDKFTMTAKQLGDGDNISIDAATQGGNFFGAAGASGIDIVNGSAVITSENQGKDALVKIDGQTLVRGSNSFAVNGTTYNLLSAHATPATQAETVSLTLDVDSVYKSIKGFVDKYNDVIGKINGKLSDKYDRSYQPLTDAQKESMSEDDIKKWEEKAKTGLLKNDSILQNITYSMRSALNEAVAGIDTNLSSIGINTSSYLDKGKLVIDDTKLKEAISKDPEKVMELFTKESTSVPTNYNLKAEQRSTRLKEEGLANRISDILDENIRTIKGKGTLLEKAGISGDATEFDNLIYDEIDGYNKNIKSWTTKLIDKENAYYTKYANLEKAISKMNSQSSWLSSQLGQGG